MMPKTTNPKDCPICQSFEGIISRANKNGDQRKVAVMRILYTNHVYDCHPITVTPTQVVITDTLETTLFNN